MGKRVLVVKNRTHEGPGLIEILLKEHQIPYEITDLDQGERFPSLESYGALVVLGGPDSANDRTAKMKEELDRIREALDLKTPYLGICLGLQALVKAAGGEVVKSPVKEIAFRDRDHEWFQVDLTEEGRRDPIFTGFHASFPIFHLHGETVILSGEMSLLGRGKWCTNQVVRVGENAYGLQGHLELTSEMFEVWLQKDPDLLKLNKEMLRKEFRFLQEEYLQNGRRLFTNFFKMSHLIPQEEAVK